MFPASGLHDMFTYLCVGTQASAWHHLIWSEVWSWSCAYDPVLGYDPVLRSGIWSGLCCGLVTAYGSRLLCSTLGRVLMLMLTAYGCGC